MSIKITTPQKDLAQRCLDSQYFIGKLLTQVEFAFRGNAEKVEKETNEIVEGLNELSELVKELHILHWKCKKLESEK